MLKKAGIVVATAAAGLLAVSPLAFAGSKDGDHHGHHGSSEKQVNSIDNDREANQLGLVNVGDVNALNNVNVCPQIPIAAGVGNILGIIGAGEADADAEELACTNDNGVSQTNND